MGMDIVESYTYSEFVDYVEVTPRSSHSDSNGYNSSEENSEEFSETKNIEEAYDLARNGWKAGIDEMLADKEIVIGGGVEIINSIAGGYVDVGKYASGDIDCMVEFIDKTERDREFLDVYVQLTYSCYNEALEAVRYAKKVVKIIQKLNTKYSVRCYGTFPVACGGKDAMEIILLKDYEQSIVLNTFAYSFHPAFFRRLWFKKLETTDYCSGGYGSPIMNDNKLSEEYKINSQGEDFWIMPSFQKNGVDKWEEKDIKKYANYKFKRR